MRYTNRCLPYLTLNKNLSKLSAGMLRQGLLNSHNDPASSDTVNYDVVKPSTAEGCGRALPPGHGCYRLTYM